MYSNLTKNMKKFNPITKEGSQNHSGNFHLQFDPFKRIKMRFSKSKLLILFSISILGLLVCSCDNTYNGKIEERDGVYWLVNTSKSKMITFTVMETEQRSEDSGRTFKTQTLRNTSKPLLP